MIHTISELVAVVNQLRASRSRVIIGIVGEPGSGKSTFTDAISHRLGCQSATIPMDGFHLSNRQLHRLNRAERKGAPDTFDVAGYVNLLRRLRDPSEEIVYAPDYVRDFEEPIAGSIAVPSEVPVVFTEGNYLLYADHQWDRVAPLLDQAWYLESDADRRIERLIRRHEQFGKSPAAAVMWATGSDEQNARIVRGTRTVADLEIDGDSLGIEIPGPAPLSTVTDHTLD